MTTTPEEQEPSDALQMALIGFTGCVGEAVSDICSYGLTIGETYVPFDPDPEDGEAPTASDVLVAATQAMADMQAIMCAALGCEVWDAIEVGEWSPSGPLGGQYGGIWTFTVELA
jgi:hypothetical protein